MIDASRNVTSGSSEVALNPDSTKRFQPYVELISMVIKLFHSLGGLLRSFTDTLTYYRENSLDTTIGKIESISIHRKLMLELRRNGLSSDWYKMILDRQDFPTWLKDSAGAYVAINTQLYKRLALGSYKQILGLDNQIIGKMNKDNDDVIDFITNCATGDAIVRLNAPENGVVLNGTKMQMLKYQIKNEKGQEIAIFGMLIDTKLFDAKDILVIEMEMIELLKIIDKNAVDVKEVKIQE